MKQKKNINSSKKKKKHTLGNIKKKKVKMDKTNLIRHKTTTKQ